MPNGVCALRSPDCDSLSRMDAHTFRKPKEFNKTAVQTRQRAVKNPWS